MSDIRLAVCTFANAAEREPRQEVLTLDQLTAAFTRFAVVENTSPEALPVWSPTWYAMRATRGSANVIHLSCLVLDYDASYLLTQATQDWHEHFHIVHSTWAHTEAVPRFRVIVPLAHPVRGGDWRGVWQWARQQSHGHIDSGAEQADQIFLLPAVPTAESPRFAFSHGGPLLNPRALGLVTHAARAPAATHQPHREGFFHRASELADFVEPMELELPPSKSLEPDPKAGELPADSVTPAPEPEPEPKLEPEPEQAEPTTERQAEAEPQSEMAPPPSPDEAKQLAVKKKPPKRATKPTIEVLDDEAGATAVAALQRGLDAAAPALESVISRMQEGLQADCDVSEIEIELAFSGAGEFLGFGSGGDITVRVRVRPQERAVAAPRRQKRSTGA